MTEVKNYLSLIKFSHTVFAMPFALVGFSLGVLSAAAPVNSFRPGSISDYSNILYGGLPLKLLLVILCMVLARSAAMAFNRFLDRHFDAKNPRTAIREIPSGVIKANNALIFTIVCSLLFILCTFFINKLCFFLSPVALLVVLGYSYTKRFTTLCHLVLGLGLSLAPIGAWLAVTGYFHWLPVLFSLAVLFWVSGFDIIYALQDEEFDREHQLYSLPALVGKVKALGISRFLHALSAGCLVTAGVFFSFGSLYWAGTIIFTGMLVYQHSLVRPGDLKRVNLAFMTANGIASVVFALFVIADLLFYI